MFQAKTIRLCQCHFKNSYAFDAHNSTPTYEFKAGPWGTFTVKTKQFDNIFIVTLNAHMYPTQDKVLIHCVKAGSVLDAETLQGKLNATVDNGTVILEDAEQPEAEAISCHVQLPMKMGEIFLNRPNS